MKLTPLFIASRIAKQGVQAKPEAPQVEPVRQLTTQYKKAVDFPFDYYPITVRSSECSLKSRCADYRGGVTYERRKYDYETGDYIDVKEEVPLECTSYTKPTHCDDTLVRDVLLSTTLSSLMILMIAKVITHGVGYLNYSDIHRDNGIITDSDFALTERQHNLPAGHIYHQLIASGFIKACDSYSHTQLGFLEAVKTYRFITYFLSQYNRVAAPLADQLRVDTQSVIAAVRANQPLIYSTVLYDGAHWFVKSEDRIGQSKRVLTLENNQHESIHMTVDKSSVTIDKVHVKDPRSIHVKPSQNRAEIIGWPVSREAFMTAGFWRWATGDAVLSDEKKAALYTALHDAGVLATHNDQDYLVRTRTVARPLKTRLEKVLNPLHLGRIKKPLLLHLMLFLLNRADYDINRYLSKLTEQEREYVLPTLLHRLYEMDTWHRYNKQLGMVTEFEVIVVIVVHFDYDDSDLLTEFATMLMNWDLSDNCCTVLDPVFENMSIVSDLILDPLLEALGDAI